MSDESAKGTRRDFLAGLSAAVAFCSATGLPRPASARGPEYTMAPEGAEIARIGIYPPIGISRVGGSTETFRAPEVPGKRTVEPGFQY